MIDTRQSRAMRRDWDNRAREDASYYVAFGRRGQEKEEFFSTADEVFLTLCEAFQWFAPGTDFRQLAAIEIGCGPGRLMLPMSQVFGRVVGVDVSGEMVCLANENLADMPNTAVRQNNGCDLTEFDDESFDFCYSYAVFQHIPVRDVIWSYLREAHRVLKPGGLMRLQFNGLPRPRQSLELEPVCGWSLRAAVPSYLVQPSKYYCTDTWSGIRLRPEELADFSEKELWRLLSMEGFDSQYLWITAHKPRTKLGSNSIDPVLHTKISRVTNTWTEDATVPASGRFASATLRGIKLPEHADLNRIRVEMNDVSTAASFIGQYSSGGPAQVNFYLPPEVRSGLAVIRLRLDGKLISEEATIRVIAAAPMVPKLLGVSDGINLLSPPHIESSVIRVSLEEVDMSGPKEVARDVTAAINGQPVESIEAFLVDPLTRRYELNLTVSKALSPGRHDLTLYLGRRRFPTTHIEVASERS